MELFGAFFVPFVLFVVLEDGVFVVFALLGVLEDLDFVALGAFVFDSGDFVDLGDFEPPFPPFPFPAPPTLAFVGVMEGVKLGSADG